MKETIGYQGVEGAYSSIATKALYPKTERKGYPSFDEVFEAIQTHTLERAVLPIENSLIGSIFEVYDLLYDYDYKITGEVILRIDHNLLTLPDVPIEHIKTVYSHPKALGQCRTFFKEHPWLKPVVHEDTAAAAKHVSETHDPTIAAIASATAGRLYGLSVLKSQIQSNPDNYTRFVSVAENHGLMKGDKTSIVFSASHEPGSLVKCMLPFDQAHLNLTKIESRPLIGSPFKYLFYLDFEHPDGNTIEDILSKITPSTTFVRNLGTYAKGITISEMK